MIGFVDGYSDPMTLFSLAEIQVFETVDYGSKLFINQKLQWKMPTRDYINIVNQLTAKVNGLKNTANNANLKGLNSQK